jgi:antirestriction protein ArdC
MSKVSVYEVVTDRIIKALERGVAPWRQEWSGAGGGLGPAPRNLVSGKAYRGVNALILGMCTPFASPYWLTFNQAKKLGGNVRKGEKATPVVFFKSGKEEAADGGKDRRWAMARYYSAFNVEQCEGLEAHLPAPTPQATEEDRFRACAEICANYSGPAFPTVRHGGSRAFYTPGADVVQLPPRDTFTSADAYYATRFHELTHSTGHESRLAREGIVELAKGDAHRYSEEELVAEMGAAFLCARAGISPATEESSASYIAHWLCTLRDDRKMLVRAASAAQKAADLVAGPLDARAEEEAEGGEEAA